MLTIRGARVVTPGKDLGVTTFPVDGGRIAAVGGVCSSRNCTHEEVGAIRGTAQDPSVGAVPRTAQSEIDASGLIALPGFIDVHSHGRGGADFCDATDAGERHYHFIWGPVRNSYLEEARGLIADPLDPLYGSFDVSWNGKWTYRSERKGDTWFSLVTLPFASLGTIVFE